MISIFQDNHIFFLSLDLLQVSAIVLFILSSPSSYICFMRFIIPASGSFTLPGYFTSSWINQYIYFALFVLKGVPVFTVSLRHCDDYHVGLYCEFACGGVNTSAELADGITIVLAFVVVDLDLHWLFGKGNLDLILLALISYVLQSQIDSRINCIGTWPSCLPDRRSTSWSWWNYQPLWRVTEHLASL